MVSKSIPISSLAKISVRSFVQSNMLLWSSAVSWLIDAMTKRRDEGRTEEDATNLCEELEKFFKCRVDVQVGDGSRALLQYVTGYSAKAEDSLTFKLKESEDRGGHSLSTWSTTYRLLTRRAPLWPELTLEMMSVLLTSPL